MRETNLGSRLLSADDFHTLSVIASERFGLSLSESKKNMISARIRKRMGQLGIKDFGRYIDLITSSEATAEDDGLIGSLTTNVTNFFREPHHFEMISKEFHERLSKRLREGGRVRVWCAGCSSGQETYSLLMTVHDAFHEVANYDFKILATDIDPHVLSYAKNGLYTNAEVSEIGPASLSKYFEKGTDGFQVKDKLKSSISFGQLNLVEPFPMRGRFDIVMCRNVAIYFDGSTQALVWTKIQRHLQDKAMLFIGHSERLSGVAANSFQNIGTTAYRHLPNHPLN